MKTLLRLILIGAVIAAMVGVPPGSIIGQEASSPDASESQSGVLISIRPSDGADGERFETTLDAGATGDLTAVLQNFGTEPIELRTYISDLIPVVNGGLRLADHEIERTGIALWIDYETAEITLEPGEAVERVITISVPEDTPPGQYVSGVALETVDPVDEGGGILQYFRKVVSIYIYVPGDLIHDFELGQPEGRTAITNSSIRFPIENTGNVRLDVGGHVVLTDLAGNVVLDQDVFLSPIYNGQSTFIQVVIVTPPPPGEYLVSYEFFDFTESVQVSGEQVAITIPEPQSNEVIPLAFETISITPNADPIVFADVSVDMLVELNPYSSTRLTLSVFHNGEFVEDFVLAENMTLAQGTTTISQRYLPGTNWKSGTYTFSLKLESLEGGSTSLLLEEEDVATLEVP